MAIKVYGNPFSPATKRVLLCLAEKGLDYEYILVDLASGQQKKEPLISINPFGQVPGFEDGDLKLFESRAMTRYIAQAYADKGTPLISSDPKKMAIIGNWMEVEAQRFEAAGGKLNVYESNSSDLTHSVTHHQLVYAQFLITRHKCDALSPKNKIKKK